MIKTAGNVTEVYTDGIHKFVIDRSSGAAEVSFWELMGGRWVRLGSLENWGDEVVEDLLERYRD